jgi:hypothetical protein
VFFHWGGTVTLYFPSALAKAPDVVPLTKIVAPGKGAPFAFVTLPETTLSYANANCTVSIKPRMREE